MLKKSHTFSLLILLNALCLGACTAPSLVPTDIDNGQNQQNTNPPDSGETNPPDGGETNPPDGGETNPPDGGETNPPDGGETNPPDDGEDEVPVRLLRGRQCSHRLEIRCQRQRRT